MLTTLAAAVLICAAAVLVGEAVAVLLRRERWRGSSPAVGIALLIALSLVAVKLPGHGATAAVACGLAILVAAVLVARAGSWPRPGIAVLGAGALAGGLALIPYLANGRFGIPAVSYFNDLAVHLPWAVQVADPDVAGASRPPDGYPMGPHALLAALTTGTGIDLDRCVAGLLLATQLLIAWAALPLLDGLRRPWRALAAGLTAGAYLVSAFYAQGGFKETLLILFLVAFVAIARDAARHPERRGPATGAQLGALGAGAVLTFSYSALGWMGLTLGIWAVLSLAGHLIADPGGPARQRLRRRQPPDGLAGTAIGAAVAGAVLLAADVPRMLDSLRLFGTSPSGQGSIATENIAHLAGRVDPYEAFNVWLSPDFRFLQGIRLEDGALVGLAIGATAYGVLWWLRRRDFAVPSAAAAALIVWAYLDRAESPYLASKGLAVLAPLLMLLATRALLDRLPGRVTPELRLARLAATAIFAAAALYSSYLVLEGAQVGPRDHSDELAQLRDTVAGEPTTFLGHDDFVLWELRGSAVTIPIGIRQAAIPTHEAPTRPEKRWRYGEPFDFDSLTPPYLDTGRYLVLPRSGYVSEPPPNFRRVRQTRSFDLWRRTGPTPTRRTLAEGGAPGAVLDCDDPRDARLSRRTGWARIWAERPRKVAFPPDERFTTTGSGRQAVLALPAGRWEISLAYTSPVPVTVGLGDGQEVEMPPNLDRPGPWWRVADVTQAETGGRRIDLHVADQALRSPNRFAELIGVAAVDLDAGRRLVPLGEACGRYVDWYVLGPERPTAPIQGG